MAACGEGKIADETSVNDTGTTSGNVTGEQDEFADMDLGGQEIRINLPGQRMTVFLQEDMISRKSTMIFMAMTAVLMQMKLIRKPIMLMKPIEKSPLTMTLLMIMPITHRSRLHTGMKVLIQTMLMVSTFRSCLRMTA